MTRTETAPASKDTPPSKTVLVDDAPTADDHFSGRAHSRIASTISKLIRDSERGFAIGLQGKWGSGKSSVASMALRALTHDQNSRSRNIETFEFDAWANQGDPTRRVLLRSLIHAFRHSLSHKRYWNKTFEQLDARRRTIRTRESTRLTGLAIMMYLLIPLIPIAYMWVSPFALLPSHSNASITPDTIQTISHFAIVILGFYYILPLAYAIRVWYKDRTLTLGSVFSFVDRRSQDHWQDQWIKDAEPTAEEFLDLLGRLSTELKSNQTGLVILVDNIDRLPREHLREFWANLRNLFSTGEGTHHHRLTNIWLLVPFDRDHVAAVFSEDEIGYPDSAGPSAALHGTLGADSVTAESRAVTGFIEKTFRVVLEVPPPILTDATEYLFELLQTHSPHWLGADDQRQIVRVADAVLLQHSNQVTPRRLKTYVNDVLVTASMWHDVIPVQHVALFISLRDELWDNLDGLRTGNYPSLRIKALAHGDWIRSMSALLYGVHPDHAMQVLLGDRVRQAVVAGDSAVLNDYAATRGFGETQVQVVDQLAVGTDAAQQDLLRGACHALVDLTTPDVDKVQEAWDLTAVRIADSASQSNFRVSLDAAECEGIANLLQHARDDLASNIAEYVIQFPSDPEDNENASHYAHRLVTSYDTLFDPINNALPGGWAPSGARYIGLATSVEINAHVLIELAKSEHITIDHFVFHAEPDQVLAYMSESVVTEREFEQSEIDRVVDLLHEFGVRAWSPLLDAIVSAIRDFDFDPAPRIIQSLLGWLVSIRRLPQVSDAVAERTQSLMHDGTLQYVFVQALEHPKVAEGIAAWLMLAAGGDESKYRQPPQQQRAGHNQHRDAMSKWDDALTQLSDNTERQTAALLESIAVAQDGDLVIDRAEPEDEDSLWFDLASKVSENPPHYGMTVEGVIDHLYLFDWLSTERAKRVAEFLSNNSENALKRIDERTFEELDPSEGEIKALVESPKPLSEGICHRLADYVKDSDTEIWGTALRDDTLLTRIILVLYKHEVPIEVPSTAIQALRTSIDELLTENPSVPPPDRGNWNLITQCLSESQKVTVYDYGWNKLVGSAYSASTIRGVLPYLGDEEGLAQIPTEVGSGAHFWRRVVGAIIEEGEDEGMEWIDFAGPKLAGLVGDADRVAQESIQATIDSKSTGEGEAGYEGMGLIAKAVKKKSRKRSGDT